MKEAIPNHNNRKTSPLNAMPNVVVSLILELITDYVDSYIYKKGKLSRIQIPEGYISVVDGKFEYFFNQTDYQGNIRAVTDAKGAVIEHNDYYPFGMLFGTSVGKDSKQPFKFGGKEYISAKGFNTYDFGARGMDASNPRWTSVDPLAEKYYSTSPYVYCANNPIKYIDPDGRKVLFAANSSNQFKKHFATAVQYLNKNKAGGMLAELHTSKKTYYIEESKKMGSEYNTKKNTISWNPEVALLTSNGIELSPTSILNHEIDHAVQHDQNPEQQKIDGKTSSENYGNKEEERVITGSEQETSKALGETKEGEVTRNDHTGTLYKTTNPTSVEWVDPIIVTREKDKNK